jgi:anti-sigma regulatory factor (Ser/Thr protein kinase)/HAMP domain-containing protein
LGNHRVAGAGLQNGTTSRRAKESAGFGLRSPRSLSLRDWPVSFRLLAVIVLALVMGLVFGGLRVAAAADSEAQFGRVWQLAKLGQQVTSLVQALQDERDETTGIIPAASTQAAETALKRWYNSTDEAAAKVRALAGGIGGSFPANIQARVTTVLFVISHLGELRDTAMASQSALAVIADYSAPIGDMFSLNQQIAQGTADSSLANDVQALHSLSLAKDQAAQQRALLFNALTQQIFADDEQQALTTAVSEQAADLTSFDTTATPGQQTSFRRTATGPLVNRAELIEEYVLSVGSLDTTRLNISQRAAPAQWYSAMSDTVDKMQAVELGVARSIVARSQVLQRGAGRSALITAVLTGLILLLVLIATLAVARSLVQPLRRLRAGALDIATVQLPERVRQLGEAQDPTTSLDVAPIDVLSADEIGQVARAFDQVHSEAVRLAGNETVLRRSFNAMFVNLSRRSQLLIERLAGMIDSLEQNEQDSDRLASLFAMDHLVTRMRRNSENLLLLAGHEGARKWSEPVSIADVARASTSEIEQYRRVMLNVQPGAAVSGHAVTDVVHLLAELIENATTFSPQDTPVHVSAQELTGGLLIEVSDSGVGISESRLAELNSRLDNPPVIDVSVSRHMGLFAVAHLAERHGVRVRLRAGSPRGLTALVWLPDSVIERGTRPYGRPSRPIAAHAAFQDGNLQDRGLQDRGLQDRGLQDRGLQERGLQDRDLQDRETARAGAATTSHWFRSRQTTGTNGDDRPAETEPPAGGGGLAETDAWAEGRHAAQIIANPVRGDRTAAGLPVRVPRANLIPGSAGGGRQAGSGATGRPAHRAESPAAHTHAARRPRQSPETARSRLAGIQRGIRRAKDQTPRAGEGADR